MRSIVSAAASRKVLDALTDPHGCAMFVMGNVEVHARRTRAGTIRLSLRQHIAPKRYEHTSHPCASSLHYIRSADPIRSVSVAFERLRRTGMERAPLLDAREGLYRLAESREVPDAWHEAPPLPRPMAYDAMTLDDVAAWRPLLEALPLRAAGLTTPEPLRNNAAP